MADEIRGIAADADDQVRIAVSLVQRIPYGYFTINPYDWAYGYEVLYSNKGVCSQKSTLLASILSELGYGCVIFEFEGANHAAVGIRCPDGYAYSSGYAFIESTAPTIITYWRGDNGSEGDIHLPSQPSEVISINIGSSMASVGEEYADALTWDWLMGLGPVLDPHDYSLYLAFVNKYGI